jgi:hypothetical protein
MSYALPKCAGDICRLVVLHESDDPIQLIFTSGTPAIASDELTDASNLRARPAPSWPTCWTAALDK